jgi:tetratricopeptide (TPR) repeat protein
MVVTTTTQREFIHWLWLWVLAAIAVSVMQGVIAGQPPASSRPNGPSGNLSAEELNTPQWQELQEGGTPIPIPNVDQPNWFRYPHPNPAIPGQTASLSELLQWHRDGEFSRALEGWRGIQPLTDSATWQQVAMGASLLHLERFDEALKHLERATRLDPNNAVAEYFIGRVRQAQGRQVPSWYESDQENPFRLTSVVQHRSQLASSGEDQQGQSRPQMLLPNFLDDAYDRLARHHFRRAIELSPKCDLDQVIRVAPSPHDRIQLASHRRGAQERITVRDLLESLGELDYLRKARASLGVPSVRQSLQVSRLDASVHADSQRLLR